MKKRGNPNWVKGVTGNPHGRPRSPEIAELREALSSVAKKNGKTFLQHFVERAYTSDLVCVALGKKIVPDKIEDESLREIVRTFLVFPDSLPRLEVKK